MNEEEKLKAAREIATMIRDHDKAIRAHDKALVAMSETLVVMTREIDRLTREANTMRGVFTEHITMLLDRVAALENVKH